MLAGCSNSSSSKAGGESKPEAYPQGYVEDFDEPKTKLADCFSILQKTARPYVEHRGCHPNKVTFSNPSVAQG
jgi:hypothetical protein